ncbi:MAG TPA: winged helix-turn-helix domain-containing protein [Spirillospora sp.]|nr:winged helix-turn-helix domain-containing protein [Spirillospora sp.]
MPAWRFLTNHAVVFILINRHRQITTREIAASLNITERTVLRIINDLEQDGYIQRRKSGRANNYHVNPDRPLSHPNLGSVPVAELLRLFPLPDVTD